VVYGVVGHKTHAKLALVVRREEGASCAATRTWAPATTTPRTARLYTDFGLFTADDHLRRRQRVFMQLTGLGKAASCAACWQSPFTLHANVRRRDQATRPSGRAPASKAPSSPR
jgi:polyphosphate kinase